MDGPTDTIIGDIAKAIATAEGFYVAGSRPQRFHNPGDLTELTDGVTQVKTVLRHFTDDKAGWVALEAKLENILAGRSRVYRSGMSILEFASMWVTGRPLSVPNNEVDHWASCVAQHLHLTTKDSLLAYRPNQTGRT